MEQISIFKEQIRTNQDLEYTQELTEYQELEKLYDYSNTYIESKGFGHCVNGKFYYTKESYEMLHYLIRFANGMKKAIPGWELSNVIFKIKNTEKVRLMINELRNDINVDLIIGSNSKGYFIAKHDELYDAIKYLFGKSVNEMITVIRMFPAIFESYIKIAQKTFQETDKACDRQVTAQFEHDTENIINEIVIRFSNTLIKESKKWNINLK